MEVDSSQGNGFEAVYRSRSTHLLRLAVLLCGNRDQAEDAVADAVARSWRRWDAGGIEDPDAYLRRAVVNAVTDGFRSRGRARNRAARRSADDRPIHQPDPSDGIVIRSAVLDALDVLPGAQRAVLVLRYFEDQTEAATADLLGIAVGTVKSRSARGLDALARMLGDKETTA